MWVIAGVLLGLVVLVALVGFHTGPHSHLVAGAIGAVAALWLAIMALDGQASALLFTLLGADLVVSAGIATAAWKSIGVEHAAEHSVKITRLEGKTGVAKTDLAPDGIVRVRGEEWTASSANGNLPAGTPVQVVSVEGVRLVVWGEDVLPAQPTKWAEQENKSDGVQHNVG